MSGIQPLLNALTEQARVFPAQMDGEIVRVLVAMGPLPDLALPDKFLQAFLGKAVALAPCDEEELAALSPVGEIARSLPGLRLLIEEDVRVLIIHTSKDAWYRLTPVLRSG